ncbi:MAG TPA: adenylosuccinate lyase [bacterium]|nr:adenylosuccinate lyase [bacterium]
MFARERVREFLDAFGVEVDDCILQLMELLEVQDKETIAFMEKRASLMAISPIDGRYADKTKEFRETFSEFGLFRFRVFVEIKWLEFLLLETKLIDYSNEEIRLILLIPEQFNIESAIRIKEIEKITNHDVNAVVEYIKECLVDIGLRKFSGYVHLFLTSEDVNNAAYSLMLKEANKIFGLKFCKFLESLDKKVENWKNIVMLGHTHGQPATPTTMGKELLVFSRLFVSEFLKVQEWKAFVKWSGATGTFAAHHFVMPEVNWPTKCEHFVRGYLRMDYISISTQINPHHDIAELLQMIIRIAGTIVDMSSDMWIYISKKYLKQKPKEGEVGSSTMPHKVNPIDWENARGNAKIAIGLCECLSRELLVSTMQRDLSDSTIQRCLGTIFSHMIIATESCIKGIGKIEINQNEINKDLRDNPEVITEGIQVFLRVLGIPDAYNKLKELSRGKKLTKKILKEFVDALDIPQKDKRKILSLTPAKYVGLCLDIINRELN